MKRILGIGNALVDALTTLNDEKLLDLFGLPKGSMTLIGNDEQVRIQERFASLAVERSTGGSAGNTMLALAHLGMQPGFIGTIGNDATGQFFAANCEEHGIVPYLTTLPQQSGVAYTFISPGGERTFATYLGAAADLHAEDIRKEVKLLPVAHAPVKKGDMLGKLVYLAGEKEVLSVPLVAKNNVEKKESFWLVRLFRSLFK